MCMTAIVLCNFLLPNAYATESLDRIIATVNDAVITQSDLQKMIGQIKKQFSANNMAQPPADVLNKQVLDQVINKKLQIQAAEQAGINVSEEDVTKAINVIASQNKVTVAQLTEKIGEQGMSFAEYRKEIHDEIQMQQIQQQEVGSKITITPQEVEDFIRSKAFQASNTKEYHLEDILVAVADTPTSEQVVAAKKHAEELLAKIHNGASFQDISTAESGVDLGWRKLAEIPTAFSEQLIHLKANDIMGPIQTPNGFHLVRLAGTRDSKGQLSAEDQKKQVHQLIFQRKFEQAMQSWVTRLRSAATINMNPEG